MSTDRRTPRVIFEGINVDDLTTALAVGIDHGGNLIHPFVDTDGGWPLRCCLSDSEPDSRLAIIAWSPYRWHGPYRETGPIVVHADGCGGCGAASTLPPSLDARPMTLRPYGDDHTILYDRVRVVEADGGVADHVRFMLEDPHVVEVIARNRVGGCYAFTARRDDSVSPPRSARP